MSFIINPYRFAIAGKSFQVDTGGTLTTGLVSYYKMEDATDYWGTNNASNTNTTFVAGKVNNGGSFNGSSAYLKSTISSGLSGDFSFSFWIKCSSPGVPGTLINSRVASYSNLWINVGVNDDGNGKIRLQKYEGSHNPFLDSTESVTDGNWHFVVAMRESGVLKIFIDNSASGSTTDTTTSVPTYSNFNIGTRQNSANQEYYGGLFDECAIHSRALTAQEITDLYNGGSGQTMV